MKGVKLILIVALAALVTIGLGNVAYAFHAGGVAHCNGCHTMHNSRDGAIATEHGSGAGSPSGETIGDTGNSNLLISATASDTCLNCHSAIYRVLSSGPSDHANVYTPGGDFWWVTQTTPTDSRGGVAHPAQHGHNVIAADFGLSQDNILSAAPKRTGAAGTPYPASALGCNSCHDPHGKKDNNANPLPIAGSGSYGDVAPSGAVMGNFRLLGGLGYDGGGTVGGFSFIAGDPVAVSYHGSRGQWPSETDTRHTDYGSGMSEWCANCHQGFTADGSAAHRHPSSDDAHLNGFATIYDAYISTANTTGGGHNSAFDRLIPFERGVLDADNNGVPNNLGPGDGSLSDNNTYGPNASSNVMCLTCHRAHASVWPDSLRWDPDDELLAGSFIFGNADFGPYTYYDDSGAAGITARYDEFQRQLCNKCHLQD